MRARVSRPGLLRAVLIAGLSAAFGAGLLPGSASAAAPPCAELTIPSFEVVPGNPISGQPAEAVIVIENRGTCAADGFVTQLKTSPSGPTVAAQDVLGLGAGEVDVVFLDYDFPTAGNFDLEADVNPSHEVPEENYLNDIATDSITVAARKASFAIKGFTILPKPTDPTEAIVAGRTAVAAITVENTGNVPAGPAEVQWTPLRFAHALAAPLAPGLAPGAQETVSLEYTYTKTGPISSKAVVTAPGRFTPFASATLERTVEAALPNLRIGHVATNPNFAGSPSTIEVTIENDGNAPAGHFEVEWQPGAGQTRQVQQVSGMEEFESRTLTFSNKYAKGGTYEGLVTVDPKSEVKELFATEKTAKTTLVVPEPSVDLTVKEVTISPAEPTQEIPASVMITVENVGNLPSPSFVTAWNPDAKKVKVAGLKTIAHEETTPLLPGEARVITLPFTYPVSGSFLTVAEVNPSRTVKESNYENNTQVLAVTVLPQPLELEFTSSALSVSPTSGIVAGKTYVEAQVTVIDRSHLPTEAFEVEFSPGGGARSQTQYIAGLNEGQSKTLHFRYIRYSAAGKYTMTAILDPKNRVDKTPGIHEATAEVEVEK